MTRSKHKSAGPTRGLIIGPTRRELELTVSGKRLRVEKDNIGSPGGSFVMDSSERSEEGNLLKTRDIENDNPRITSRADAKSKELVTRREPSEEEMEARVA